MNLAVLGAQWGDEGKGKIVDLLTPHFSIVARYQGGHNAGHTVWVGDTKYVFHIVPSSILYQTVMSVVGNGTVIDPYSLLTELEGLDKAGVKITPENFAISDRAHIIMPYHVEEERGSSLSKDVVGSTMRGIGPAYTDKARRTGIRVCDLNDLTIPGVRERALSVIEDHYRVGTEKILRTIDTNYEIGQISRFMLEILLKNADKRFRVNPEKMLEDLEKTFEPLRPYVTDTSDLINNAITQGRNVMFEGAQGAGLDVDHGTYPCVTSSNTVAGGASTGLGIGPTQIDYVLGVAKAYDTRVGKGAHPTHQKNAIGNRIAERGFEVGASTGRKRDCGWFDGVQARDAATKNNINALALMKLDVLDEEPEVKICVGYWLNGERTTNFPASDAILQQCTPIYEILDGWQKPTRGIKNLDQLPKNARKYIGRLEEVVGKPYAYISTGPERNEGIEIAWPSFE